MATKLRTLHGSQDRGQIGENYAAEVMSRRHGFEVVTPHFDHGWDKEIRRGAQVIEIDGEEHTYYEEIKKISVKTGKAAIRGLKISTLKDLFQKHPEVLFVLVHDGVYNGKTEGYLFNLPELIALCEQNIAGDRRKWRCTNNSCPNHKNRERRVLPDGDAKPETCPKCSHDTKYNKADVNLSFPNIDPRDLEVAGTRWINGTYDFSTMALKTTPEDQMFTRNKAYWKAKVADEEAMAATAQS